MPRGMGGEGVGGSAKNGRGAVSTASIVEAATPPQGGEAREARLCHALLPARGTAQVSATLRLIALLGRRWCGGCRLGRRCCSVIARLGRRCYCRRLRVIAPLGRRWCGACRNLNAPLCLENKREVSMDAVCRLRCSRIHAGTRIGESESGKAPHLFRRFCCRPGSIALRHERGSCRRCSASRSKRRCCGRCLCTARAHHLDDGGTRGAYLRPTPGRGTVKVLLGGVLRRHT